jgi:hypothetical protein
MITVRAGDSFMTKQNGRLIVVKVVEGSVNVVADHVNGYVIQNWKPNTCLEPCTHPEIVGVDCETGSLCGSKSKRRCALCGDTIPRVFCGTTRGVS